MSKTVSGFEISYVYSASVGAESAKVLISLFERGKLHTFSITTQQATDMALLLESAVGDLTINPTPEARR